MSIIAKPKILLSDFYKNQRPKENIEIIDEIDTQSDQTKTIANVIEYYLSLKNLEENSIDYKILNYQDQSIFKLLSSILDYSWK